MKRLVLTENHFHKVLLRISTDGLLARYPNTCPIVLEDGQAQTPFGSPSSVAVDAADNVYAVNGSHLVCKISMDGAVTSLFKRDQWPRKANHALEPTGPRWAAVAVDADGTLYLADEADQRIYFLPPSGALEVLIDFKSADVIAGLSNDKGLAFGEPFVPSGIAASGAGALYVASRAIVRNRRLCMRILRLTRGQLRGTMSIECSAPEIGDLNASYGSEPSDWPKYLGPHPLHATFTYPVALAVDSRENLFVANYAQNRIHKIDPAGSAVDFAGSGRFSLEDGTGTSASLRQPRGLAMDADDTLYVQDPDPHVVRKVSPAGEVSSLRARDAVASFHQPMGVAVDSDGAVYVADAFNGRICKVMPNGTTVTLARSGASVENLPAGTVADFQAPCALAVDTHRNVFTSGRQLYRISPDGRVWAVAGRIYDSPLEMPLESLDGSADMATIICVRGIDVDAEGNLYLAEAAGVGKVRVVSPAGEVRTLARFEQHLLMGLALAADGHIYVTSHRGSVLRVGLDGRSDPVVERSFPSHSVFGVAADAEGAIYVAQSHPGKIIVREPNGSWRDFAGSEASGSEDGPVAIASFASPTDVAVDRKGNVYVADSANHRVRKIEKFGIVSTLAGSGLKGDSDRRLGP